MRLFVRKSTLVAAGLTLVTGLALGFIAGAMLSPAPTAHAIGINGAIEISVDGSLFACTPTLGCTQHPAGTCTFQQDSTVATCLFALAPHNGGAIVQKGLAECFFIQPSGSYFTSFNSDIVYAPSGQVYARCER